MYESIQRKIYSFSASENIHCETKFQGNVDGLSPIKIFSWTSGNDSLTSKICSNFLQSIIHTTKKCSALTIFTCKHFLFRKKFMTCSALLFWKFLQFTTHIYVKQRAKFRLVFSIKLDWACTLWRNPSYFAKTPLEKSPAGGEGFQSGPFFPVSFPLLTAFLVCFCVHIVSTHLLVTPMRRRFYVTKFPIASFRAPFPSLSLSRVPTFFHSSRLSFSLCLAPLSH